MTNDRGDRRVWDPLSRVKTYPARLVWFLEHKTQHPNAMRAYVRHFVNDGGQWWIPTVSTTLVDCVPFYNQEDARRRILLWHSSRRPALQNLTADDADRFMSALRTGFQTVSQVLLSKDIW
jgi:hypothetical protein